MAIQVNCTCLFNASYRHFAETGRYAVIQRVAKSVCNSAFCEHSRRFHVFVHGATLYRTCVCASSQVKWTFACNWQRNCQLGAIYLYFARDGDDCTSLMRSCVLLPASFASWS